MPSRGNPIETKVGRTKLTVPGCQEPARKLQRALVLSYSGGSGQSGRADVSLHS